MNENKSVQPGSFNNLSTEISKPYILTLNRLQQDAFLYVFGNHVDKYDRSAQIMPGVYYESMEPLVKSAKELLGKVKNNYDNPSGEADYFSLELSTRKEQLNLRGDLGYALAELTYQQVGGNISPTDLSRMNIVRKIVKDLTDYNNQKLILGEKLMMGLVDDVSNEELKEAMEDVKGYHDLSRYAAFFLKIREQASN